MKRTDIIKQEHLVKILRHALKGDEDTVFVLDLPKASIVYKSLWGHQTELAVVLNDVRLESIQKLVDEECQ